MIHITCWFANNEIFQELFTLFIFTGTAAGKSKSRIKKSWTTKEKIAVARHLRHFLASRSLPGKVPIEVMLKAEPAVFKGRTWRNIKDFVRNQTRKTNPMSFLET